MERVFESCVLCGCVCVCEREREREREREKERERVRYDVIFDGPQGYFS